MATATPTVTIACKMPNGLILRLFDMIDGSEPVMGGGTRSVKVAQEVSERVVIHGFSHPQNAAPKALIVGGYALTSGVSKEFWDRWLKDNANTAIVKNRLIFAHEKQDNTKAEAREKKETRSGLERLDPKKLPKGIQRSDLMPKVAETEEA